MPIHWSKTLKGVVVIGLLVGLSTVAVGCGIRAKTSGGDGGGPGSTETPVPVETTPTQPVPSITPLPPNTVDPPPTVAPSATPTPENYAVEGNLHHDYNNNCVRDNTIEGVLEPPMAGAEYSCYTKNFRKCNPEDRLEGFCIVNS